MKSKQMEIMPDQKPIAYQQGHAGPYCHTGDCWEELTVRVRSATGRAFPAIGDIYYGPHPRINREVCEVCHGKITEPSLFTKGKRFSEQLKSMLPEGWNVTPYGYQGAAACFPAKGFTSDADNFHTVNRIAPISSVTGFCYVVCNLR